MGDPLSPDRVFDFPIDELEPHPAYDFFAPETLPEYADMVDEPMEDLVALFGDDDFEDDASDGFDEEEVWEVNVEWLMAPTTPPPMLAVPLPSVYEVRGPSTSAGEGPSLPHSASGLSVPPSVIKDLSTCLGNLEYGHGQLGLCCRGTGTSDSIPNESCYKQMGAGTAGTAGSSAAERHADPAAADYSYWDGQPGEHTDAVHLGDG
ncbi:hypothetical protein Tco_1571520 [Tanacetum coccineum]